MRVLPGGTEYINYVTRREELVQRDAGRVKTPPLRGVRPLVFPSVCDSHHFFLGLHSLEQWSNPYTMLLLPRLLLRGRAHRAAHPPRSYRAQGPLPCRGPSSRRRPQGVQRPPPPPMLLIGQPSGYGACCCVHGVQSVTQRHGCAFSVMLHGPLPRRKLPRLQRRQRQLVSWRGLTMTSWLLTCWWMTLHRWATHTNFPWSFYMVVALPVLHHDGGALPVLHHDDLVVWDVYVLGTP